MIRCRCPPPLGGNRSAAGGEGWERSSEGEVVSGKIYLGLQYQNY